jgi:type I restriction enzyme S subunit
MKNDSRRPELDPRHPELDPRHPELDSGSNIPKLRFPEFKNEPEWEEKTLSKVGEIITGNTPPTANLENYGGSELFVSPADISDKRYITTTKTTLSKQGFKQTRQIKANSILFVCIGSTIGKVAQNKFDCATNQQINSIVPFDEYSNDFVYSALENSSSRIALLAGNHAVPIINKSSFSSVLILCPLFPEQQKIADCLSSLDNLITAQSKKVETLKEHKKGLMQQLFPQEGEKVPKLRFPEFENEPEWEEKILDDVADYENGKAHENDISENGKYIVVNSKFISTEGDTRKYTNNSFCMADIDDILMVLSDVPNGRAIAKCYLVESDDLYTVNQRICKLTAKETYISKFLFYILDRNKYFLSFDDGVKQTNLRKEDVLNCPILVPSNPKEQQKIADCISSIDELITSSTKKVETLKEHKKGLMQKLFPNHKEIAK